MITLTSKTAERKRFKPPSHIPKLYKTLQQQNIPYIKVTTPGLMTALVQLLLKRLVNKNPTHNEIIDFYGLPGTLLLAYARNNRLYSI